METNTASDSDSENKTTAPSFTDSVKTKAAGALDEVEKIGDLIIKEVREGFGVVSGKVASAARSASEIPGDMVDRVSGMHPKEVFSKVVDEVEEVAGELMEGIASRVNQMRGAAAKAATQPAKRAKRNTKKKAAKKKAAKKKAAKKKVAKKKAKKKVAKKKVAKKKAKKKVAKKKLAKKKAKKKAAKKKLAKKKAKKRVAKKR